MRYLAMSVLFAASAACGLANADVLAKVKESGQIVVGVRESGGALSYSLGNGKYGGFHVELCQRVAADIQKHLAMPKIDIKYVQVHSTNRIPLVMNGTVDLECGVTTNNATRKRDVDFAVTTFIEEGKVAVRASSGIKSLSQLNGKSVATVAGTTSIQNIKKHEKGSSVNLTEVIVKTDDEAFALLEQGKADAYVMDSQILAGYIANSKAPGDYRLLEESLSVEPIAIMIRKDDAAFKKFVDSSLSSMMKSGEISKIYDKWFVQPMPPNGIRLGLSASKATKHAWANPNDKAMEELQKP